MGFGCSYSLVDVDCIDWVKTSWPKKLARTVLAIAITGSFMFLVEHYGKSQVALTEFVLYNVIPMSFISFIMYGPFLVICQKLNLVGDGYEE